MLGNVEKLLGKWGGYSESIRKKVEMEERRQWGRGREGKGQEGRKGKQEERLTGALGRKNGVGGAKM